MTFVQGSALGRLGMVKRFATESYPQQMRVQNLSMPMPVVPQEQQRGQPQPPCRQYNRVN
jgi:hypothetical protein